MGEKFTTIRKAKMMFQIKKRQKQEKKLVNLKVASDVMAQDICPNIFNIKEESVSNAMEKDIR